jgi:hypothetical protein
LIVDLPVPEVEVRSTSSIEFVEAIIFEKVLIVKTA